MTSHVDVVTRTELDQKPAQGLGDALAYMPGIRSSSFAQLAQGVGKPTALRAVGAANGRNPLPIVLPCHRVIGSSGALTGFGGGLPTKAALLQALLPHHTATQPYRQWHPASTEAVWRVAEHVIALCTRLRLLFFVHASRIDMIEFHIDQFRLSSF